MNEKFTYLISNLDLSSPNLIGSIIGLVIGILFVGIVRYMFLEGYGYLLVRNDAKELAKKKSTLSDLILMKDIQTELEKEIEQAMLKATFQG